MKRVTLNISREELNRILAEDDEFCKENEREFKRAYARIQKTHKEIKMAL